MRKLLSAGLSRLKKDKIFWCGMLFLFGLGIFVAYSKYSDIVRYGEPAFLDDAMFTYVVCVGCCGAIFGSLFIGTEYSEGTIRNKLITGHGRRAIYGSNLFLCIFAAVSMTLSFLLPYIALGSWLLEKPRHSFGEIACYVIISLFTIVAYTSLFTMLSMLIHKKSSSAVLCLLLFLGMLILAMTIKARLDAPEYVSSYSLTVNGVEESVPELNPRYLQPAARRVYQFFLDILPSGQSIQLSSFTVISPVWLMLYSAVATVVITAAGMLVFVKRDLK